MDSSDDVPFKVGDVLESRIDLCLHGLPPLRAVVRFAGKLPRCDDSDDWYGLDLFPRWSHLGDCNGRFGSTVVFRPMVKDGAIFLPAKRAAMDYAKLTVEVGDSLELLERPGEAAIVQFVGNVDEDVPSVGLELSLNLAAEYGMGDGCYKGHRYFSTHHWETAAFFELSRVWASCRIIKDCKKRKLSGSCEPCPNKRVTRSVTARLKERSQANKYAAGHQSTPKLLDARDPSIHPSSSQLPTKQKGTATIPSKSLPNKHIDQPGRPNLPIEEGMHDIVEYNQYLGMTYEVCRICRAQQVFDKDTLLWIVGPLSQAKCSGRRLIV